MFRIRRDRVLPTWSALLVGPAVGAGLALTVAARMKNADAVVGFAIGGAIAGLVAGLVLFIADKSRKKRVDEGQAGAPTQPLQETCKESGVARFGMRCFSALLVLIGLTATVIEGRNLIEGVRSQSWQPTPARVLRVKADIGQGYKKDSYYFWLTYQYRFEEEQYRSDRIQFGSLGINSREEWEAWQDRFRQGSDVTAYVDPVAPDKSVLIPGVGVERYLLALVFGPLMIVGGVLGFRFLSAR